MNEIELAVQAALAAQGEEALVNKAYLEFMKANFIMPIEKKLADTSPEVLFLCEGANTFLPLFTNMEYFTAWAERIRENIHLLQLSGVDLLKGIGADVTVCLNPGSSLYKEFNPGEIARMRSMVLKWFSPG